MKIIATVNFGKTQVAQHWEYHGEPFRHLVLLRAEREGQDNVPLVLKLEGKVHNHKNRAGHAIRENNYIGPLDAADAVFL